MEMTMLPLVTLLVIFLVKGADSTTFTLHNNCPFTIWPATQANSGVPQLSQTGLTLNNGASASIGAPAGWSGRIWGRRMCHTDSSGRFSCDNADCGTGQVACNGAGGATPATLAEIQLNAYAGLDYYDVSVVDGYNLPMTFVNQGGSGNCGSASCPVDVNASCPAALKVIVNGNLLGCNNNANYASFYQSQCPHAYDFSTDNSKVYTCAGANYLITFCP